MSFFHHSSAHYPPAPLGPSVPLGSSATPVLACPVRRPHALNWFDSRGRKVLGPSAVWEPPRSFWVLQVLWVLVFRSLVLQVLGPAGPTGQRVDWIVLTIEASPLFPLYWDVFRRAIPRAKRQAWQNSVKFVERLLLSGGRSATRTTSGPAGSNRTCRQSGLRSTAATAA